jgi:DUF1009 family protein
VSNYESQPQLAAFAAPNADKKVGLIAGWGRFPVLLAEQLTQRGYQVFCLGIAGHADAGLAGVCDDYRTVGLTRMGAQIRYFRRHGIREITLAGKIHKVLLFNRDFLWQNLPDLVCIRTFFPHYISRSKTRSDDSLLGAIVESFEKRGLNVKAATELVPNLLVKCGHISGKPLSKSQQQDVAYAWHLAKSMGSLDVGQSVAVKGRAVLAVEAVEGTDQCIRRAGLLCPSGGFTVAKVAKPQQDMRFDVPTIGIGTVQSLVAAGGSVLAIEAEKTIIVDEATVTAYAERNGITITSVHAPAIERATSAAA